MATTPGYPGRRLGAALKAWRKQSNLTLGQVATRLGWDGSKVSRIENAKTGLRRLDLLKLGALYGIPSSDLEAMEAWLEDSSSVQWWAGYKDILTTIYEERISLESQSTRIVTAASSAIPGLLQAPGYARATFEISPFVTDPDDASALVEIRSRRQRIFIDNAPVTYTALLAEALLHARIASLDVHREQLAHLLELSSLGSVEVRIAPFASPFLVVGEVSILEFNGPQDPSVVFVEYQNGALFKETPRDVLRFRRLLDRTADACLSGSASRDLIKARLEELK
ncbi:helix-turn-helix domain-containing protein [Embleya sp. NPDC059237]|uniref:helix-turn-helix domain-containing protein n=1 Tax=Embleya sp. NPDC059237 TaxID=3346784 RepID=UPI0036D037E1